MDAFDFDDWLDSLTDEPEPFEPPEPPDAQATDTKKEDFEQTPEIPF